MEQKLTTVSYDLDLELIKLWVNNLQDYSRAKGSDFDKFLKILYDVLEELSRKGFFQKEKIDNEGENYFISTLGPKMITYILSEKMKEPTCCTIARDILEIFMKEFAQNMRNTRFNPIWEATTECFRDSHAFYSNSEAYDIGDRFWVLILLNII